MLTKEECEKACLYLLGHCYEEKKNEDGTYEFTPSGFVESEIFKQLINEHFDNPPLKFEDLNDEMWVWDNEIKEYIKLSIINNILYYGNDKEYRFGDYLEFEENRFYRYEVKENG